MELFQHLPGRHEVAVVERRQGPVDQKQIHIVETEVREGLVERFARVFRFVERVVELACDEDVAAVEARGAQALTDLTFVAVHLGRVDVPVANPEGLGHSLSGLLRFDLEDPETELRDSVATVQCSAWYRAQSVTLLYE